MTVNFNSNKIIQNFQEEIFEKSQGTSISFTDRITLFFKSFKIGSNLIFEGSIDGKTSSSISETLSQKISVINFIARGMLNPLNFLPKEGSAPFLELKINNDISREIDELIKDEKFDDFSLISTSKVCQSTK